MENNQTGILLPVPKLARYLMFSLKPNTTPHDVVKLLAKEIDGETIVVGFGLSLIQSCNGGIQGLRTFSAHTMNGIDIPSTPIALCCWIREADKGVLVHITRKLKNLLTPSFVLEDVIDAFQYDASRDLTGYEDGTENPEGDDAIKASLVTNLSAGMNGSSFMVIQQWEHDLDYFESLSSETQDHTIGRRKSDNEELDESPKSAHVKRTAQEDFDPEAFIVRRSMPWASANKEGLVFVAFGKSFDAFEALLKRMIGADDGVLDALFTFTRPVTGSYFWCPPMKDNCLDLSAVFDN